MGKDKFNHKWQSKQIGQVKFDTDLKRSYKTDSKDKSSSNKTDSIDNSRCNKTDLISKNRSDKTDSME